MKKNGYGKVYLFVFRAKEALPGFKPESNQRVRGNMKILKKTLCLLLAVAVSAGCVLLAGCGKKEDPDTITVGVANNTSEINILNTFREAYMKANPGKNIKIVRITGSFDNALLKLNNAEDLPDIVQVYDFSAEYWTEAGIYYPISDFMARDGLQESDYFDSVISLAKSGTDGKMYWAPRDYNKVVVCYNKEIFDAAEVPYPTDDWTWTKFQETCEALAAKSSEIMAVTGQQIFYPVDMNLNWESVYYPAIRSYGSDLFDKTAGTAIPDATVIKTALDSLLSLADEELAVSPSETGSPFPAQQCAMHFTVRPNIVSFANSIKDDAGNPAIDFASVPAFEGVEKSYIGMGCTGYAITDQCAETKREDAWNFLKFVMTEAGQNAFCASGAGVPILKEMAEDENAAFRKYLPDANHDAFIQFTDRDLPMNYMSGLNPKKHLAIRSVLVTELTKNYFAAANRQDYLTELKEKLENALR